MHSQLAFHKETVNHSPRLRNYYGDQLQRIRSNRAAAAAGLSYIDYPNIKRLFLLQFYYNVHVWSHRKDTCMKWEYVMMPPNIAIHQAHNRIWLSSLSRSFTFAMRSFTERKKRTCMQEREREKGNQLRWTYRICTLMKIGLGLDETTLTPFLKVSLLKLFSFLFLSIFVSRSILRLTFKIWLLYLFVFIYLFIFCFFIEREKNYLSKFVAITAVAKILLYWKCHMYIIWFIWGLLDILCVCVNFFNYAVLVGWASIKC